MYLYRVNQYLVHPSWPRLVFTEDRTPRILDEPAAIDGTRAYIYILLGDLWAWAQADTRAGHAWQAAIQAHESGCHAAMCADWQTEGRDPGRTAWDACAQAERLKKQAWACEVQATIVLHDAMRHVAR